MKKSAFSLFIISFLFLLACNTSYKAEMVHYSNYKIERNTDQDKTLTSILKPYGDSVNKKMDVVIGYNSISLERKKQDNVLGYFMTDACLQMAKQKIDPDVDAAFMNSGGVRLPDLPAGAITQGKIFELMPFDNLMMVVKIKGSLLEQYLDTLAATDGIIVSGITLQIADKKTQHIMVGGKPLDLNAEYSIVHSDYVIINTALLKNLDHKANGYLLRDALIDYVKLLNDQNKKITVLNTDRVSYVN